jgi:hypothetical protein
VTDEVKTKSKKKFEVKGTVQKYWFYASSIISRVLDGVATTSVFAAIFAWLTGATSLIVVFVAIGLVSFLVRLGLTAYNYNKGRYSPIETEYRVTILENQMNGFIGEEA